MIALLLGIVLSTRSVEASPEASSPAPASAVPGVPTEGAGPPASLPLTSPEGVFAVGNAALAKGDLAAAELAYRAVLAVAPDPDVYYNLGNVLWREGQVAGAILAWRTSAVDAPRDPDVVANLAFAHRSTKDALAAPTNVPDWAPWMSALSVGEAAWSASALLGLALVALGLRRNAPHAPVVGSAFVSGGVGFVLAVSALAHANADPTAVILVSEVAVTSDLGGGVTLFSLHAGAEVLVAEASDGSMLVVLADGRRGWVPASTVGRADPSVPFPVL